MKCFNEQTLPVLSTLAKEYVLCDHWFSAVPGPTIPNRMFAHAGTSLGSVSQNPDLTRLKTIFELIDVDPAAANADYRIYRADATLLLSVAHLIENQLGFRDYNQFADDCAAGDLPLYSFIEPRFGNDLNLGLAASDQHPNHDAVEGERLIHNVYTAIRNNRSLWESTVLLIVYDEHGGIFDHIEPPRLNLPQPATPANPQFAFDRLGVRVPAVVVSAYVQEGGIDSTVYDHCSILAMFRRIIPGLQPLSYRDQIAMPSTPSSI